ncbi:MAG: hypothetical protein FWH14_06470 [Oscillospiraceae bacterium]|nr:hypothetical protein [Oscillospiraceae bacterium]
MALVSLPAINKINLWINGQKVAAVKSFRSRTVRELTRIDTIGSADPIAVLPGRPIHYITLERVMWSEGLHDYQDFHSMQPFTVTLARLGKTIAFHECYWTSLDEKIQAAGGITDKAEFVSFSSAH